MMDAILAPVVAWIIAVLSAGSYAGVALLMAIESMNVPLPSEVVLPFTGVLVGRGAMNLHAAALAAAVGCTLGSLLSYAIGYYGGRPFMQRYGKWLLVGQDDLARAEALTVRYGRWPFFVTRLLPVVRTFISFPAGVLRAPLAPFIALSFLGSWLWSYALIYAGMQLGDHWETLRPIWHKIDIFVVVVVVAGCAWYVWRHVTRTRHAKRAKYPIKEAPTV